MILTFSPTVFFILAPASLTVFPALFTALYKKLPIDFAPCKALIETGNIKKKKIFKKNCIKTESFRIANYV